MARHPLRTRAVTPHLSRRGAIALLGAGALSGLALPIDVRAEDVRLSPPRTPMLFRRRVWRDLLDGNAIIAERGFEVRFLPLSDGYRVEGAQVSSTLETPPDLERLAKYERERIETGFFPLKLDSGGFVIGGDNPVPPPAFNLDKAIDVAIDILRESGSNEATIRDAQGFFLWLSKAAGTIGADMPRDLFRPPSEPQRAMRTIALPGGSSGTIEVVFQGRISPATGLMSEAERSIVTRTEGTAMTSIESWALGPA